MKTIGLALWLCLLAGGTAFADPLRLHNAWRQPAPDRMSMFGAAAAGDRIVAVGELGGIILSDDGGRSFRQAATVPVQASLLDVHFADERRGWAVGHWGVILATEDGGEHWTLQHSDLEADRPFFSVWFRDTRRGWAVGLWSMVYETRDGGGTWTEVALPPPPGETSADTNLMAVFGDATGNPVVAGEFGRIVRSLDGGTSWVYADTGYGGSFWTGARLRSGTMLVAGMLGNIYRSEDGGDSWSRVVTGTSNSLTDIMELADGSVLAVGLSGTVLVSSDGGKSFTIKSSAEPLAYTAAANAKAAGTAILFSKSGPGPVP